MTTICVVCLRTEGYPGDTSAPEPDLCSAECRADWETSLHIEVDPDAQCGTVAGTNGGTGVYIPPCPAALLRQEAAWRMALGTGVVRVGDLAVYYPDVTRETLRKDLVHLAQQGHLQAHGENKGRWYGPVRRDSMERRDVLEQRGVEAVPSG